MYHAEVIKLMIASPSDVITEREVIRDIVHNWNFVHSEDKAVVLMPVGWDTHANPEMGDRPQELLNRRIVLDCDCLVAVFWTRIGSPTGRAVSGTVEEIDQHIGAGRPAMIYFSNAPVRPDSVDDAQYKSLLEFRGRCRDRGLIETYDTIDEFREKFSRQLAQTVIREFNRETANDVPDSMDSEVEHDRPETDRVIHSLTGDARRLLLEGALAGDGMIMAIRNLHGLVVQVRGRQLTKQGDLRSEARWEAAVRQLRELDLLRDLGHKGELFRLTNLGYQVNDRIRSGGANWVDEVTMQRRAWIDMNNGEDIRGSRPYDKEAQAAIECYGGIRTSTGDYRFADNSILLARDGRVVASPDHTTPVKGSTI